MSLRKFFSEFGFEPKINNPILLRPKRRYLLKPLFALLRVVGRLPLILFRRAFFSEVNSRLFEPAYVLRNLPDKKSNLKVLDFGCAESILPVQMATFGYNVTGVDLQDCDVNHPNFTFIKGNFLKNKFSDESYDVVTAVSAIEHAGLGSYNSPQFSGGDRKIVVEIFRILKPGGLFIITEPFGQKHKDEFLRIYDEKSLRQLTDGFKVIDEQYFLRSNDMSHWVKTTAKIAEKVKYDPWRGPDGCVCMVLKKK